MNTLITISLGISLLTNGYFFCLYKKEKTKFKKAKEDQDNFISALSNFLEKAEKDNKARTALFRHLKNN